MLIAQAVIIALALINYNEGIDILQSIARFSGRLSLIIFSLIFIFKPLKRADGSSPEEHIPSTLSYSRYLIRVGLCATKHKNLNGDYRYFQKGKINTL